MKLHKLNRSSSGDRSLTVNHNLYKNFLKIWHYHEELELVLILKSSGVRFVGDHIGQFDSGELILIGENLPHMWMNDKKYFEDDSGLQAEAWAIHFKKSFLGSNFFNIPEMHNIASLLEAANRGIKFNDVDSKTIDNIKNLNKLESTERLLQLLNILHQLSKIDNYNLLSSSGFVNHFQKTDNRRLDKMYEFIFQNFNTPIKSSDVAKHMFMNNAAFSRFFKKIHRKSFTRYINEIRIGYACKLLLEGSDNINSVGYQSGFNNVSNFNRQFKLIKEVSPTQYLKSRKQP